MMSHTPGPWEVQAPMRGLPPRALVTNGDYVIADCGIETNGVAQANARLMAASPDLADALEALLIAMRGTPYARLLGERVTKAEAALRKAGRRD